MRYTLFACAVLGAMLLLQSTAIAEERKMNFQEVVHGADAIFIGRVAAIDGFEIPSMVCTRVTFDAISPIVIRPSAAPFMGDTVSIEYAGGSVPGRTTNVCGQPYFEVGTELLVMTQMDGKHYFSPFSGGRQGLFRIVKDEDGAMWPLTWAHRGMIRGGLFELRQTDPVHRIHEGLPEYMDLEGSEEVTTPVSLMGGIAITNQGKRPDSILSLDEFQAAIARATKAPTPALIEQLLGKRPEFGPVSLVRERPTLLPIIHSGHSETTRGSWCYCGYVDPNQNMEQVPTSWGNTWDNNNWTMACWNDIADLFVYHSADGYWGNNTESEFCGWPTSAEIADEYGSFSWGTATALCVTTTWCECCKIREADIMFNPSYSWYYDIDSVVGTSGSQCLYRRSCRHELGHSVGLEAGGTCGAETYQYNVPCAMGRHNSQTCVEDARGVHAIDALAIRDGYPDNSFEDVGAESWYASGEAVSATLDPDAVLQGETFDIDGVSVENISTTVQQDVRLRVYLSSNNTISEGDHLVDEFEFSNMPKNSSWSGDLHDIPVSFGIDPGSYYVGLIATIDGDDYDWDDYNGNNATWVPETITVGEGNPFSHWSLAPILNFNFLNANHFINSANSDDDGGGDCNGSPFIDGVWCRFIAPYEGILRMHMQGENGSGLDGNPTCNSYIQLFSAADGEPGELITQGCQTCLDPLQAEVARNKEYFVRIGGLGEEPATGWLNLEINTPVLPGDDPEFAFPVGRGSRIVDLTTFSSTTPNGVCGQEDVVDAWHQVIAPNFAGSNAVMRATTCSQNTAIDTTLAVFGADASLIDCLSVDDCSDLEASTLEWPIEPGKKYYIRVACTEQNRGPYMLSVQFSGATPEWNDCENPYHMQGNQQSFNTWGATASSTTNCEGTVIGKDVWMTWTAPESGWIRAGTCSDIGGSANFDTAVSIRTGCDIDLVLACNDDAASDGTSIVETEVEANSTYYIQVGTAGEDTLTDGAGVLSVVYFEPDSLPCDGDINGDGTTGIDDLLSVLEAWGTSDPDADVAPDGGDGIVGVDDLLFIIENWGCE